MRRLTAGATALVAWGWSGVAGALGLGDIEVRSHLNQAFAAVVPLVSVGDDELDAISVRLADSQAYARAGVEPVDYLSTLRFAIVRNAAGEPVVRITSPQLARDPVLSLVLEARWPGGKLEREFTVLLDPPTFEERSARAPAPAAAAAARPAPAEAKPAVAPPSRPAAPAPAASTAPIAPIAPIADVESAAGNYGPVAAGETLWSIATRLRPSLGGSLEQILLSLYERNPEAFEGRIDRLLKGSTLRTPSAAELRRVDAASAKARIDALMGVPPAAITELPPAAPTAAPTAPRPSPAPAAAAPKSAEPAGIQAPDLREALSPRPSAATPAPTAPAAAAPPAAPSASPSASSSAAGSGDQTPPPAAVDAAPAEAASTPAPEAVPAPAPMPAPASDVAPQPATAAVGFDWQSLPVLGGAAAVLVGLLGVVAVRRRRREQAELAPVPPPRFVPAIDPPDDPAIRDVLLDEPAPPPVIEPAPVPEPEPEPVAAAAPPPAAAPEPEPVALAPEPGDPIAEADYHLSYGLHDEATGILQKALAAEPQRLDLKRKLAEALFAGRRGTEFAALAEDLRTELDTGDWQRLVAMGRSLIPNSPLFRPTMELQPGPLPDLDPLDFDLGNEPAPAARPEPEAPGGASSSSDDAPSGALAVANFDLAKGSDGRIERIDFNLDELDLANSLEGEAEFTVGDEADTKLDLARAYADMGDAEAARSLLAEVIAAGNDKQKAEAQALHERLSR